MNCASCGAPLRFDADQNLMVCDYCGCKSTPPFDEAGVQILGQTACPCPICNLPLSNARLDLHDVLYCGSCHGTLVRMDNFMFLIDDLRDHRDRGAAALLTSNAAAAVSPSGLLCPLCKQAMNHHAFGGGETGELMIDSCERCCQIWVNRGTLAKIVLTTSSEVSADARLEIDPAEERAQLIATLARQLLMNARRR